MLLKKKENWAGKVRLIGLSIDQDAAKLRAHIKAKDWTKVEHYHVSNGKCTASADMGSGGVPHVLLVDTHGKIVFSGHPASIDIEATIDKLLLGETIDAKKEASDDEAEAPKEAGAFSNADATATCEKFKATVEKMIADEALVSKCKKMQRAFFVLTTEGTFDARSGELKHALTFHTLAMGGDKEGRDMVEAQTKELRDTANVKNNVRIM